MQTLRKRLHIVFAVLALTLAESLQNPSMRVPWKLAGATYMSQRIRELVRRRGRWVFCEVMESWRSICRR